MEQRDKITWVKQSTAYFERKLTDAGKTIAALYSRLEKHQTELSSKGFSTLNELLERVGRRRALLHGKIHRLQDKYARLIVRVRKLLTAVSRGRLLYQGRLLNLREEHHSVMTERDNLIARVRQLEDHLSVEKSRSLSLQADKESLTKDNARLVQEGVDLRNRAANAERTAREQEAARLTAEAECGRLRIALRRAESRTNALGWACGVAIPSALGLAAVVLLHLR